MTSRRSLPCCERARRCWHAGDCRWRRSAAAAAGTPASAASCSRAARCLLEGVAGAASQLAARSTGACDTPGAQTASAKPRPELQRRAPREEEAVEASAASRAEAQTERARTRRSGSGCGLTRAGRRAAAARLQQGRASICSVFSWRSAGVAVPRWEAVSVSGRGDRTNRDRWRSGAAAGCSCGGAHAARQAARARG